MQAPADLPHSLHLDERQRAMLDAMGVHCWWPQALKPEVLDTAAPTPPTVGQANIHTAASTVTSLAPTNRAIANKPYPSSQSAEFDLKKAQPISPSAPPTTAAPAAGTPQHAMPPAGESPWSDWDSLTNAIKRCQACGLCQGRRHAVPGTGHRQADWMVVGQGPDEQEDRLGEPFVGPAGQLLDAMLAAMGLDRERGAYLTNAIKCRPQPNRSPEPAEVVQCQAYLLRQIELVQPRIILALGPLAAQALLANSVPDVATLPLGRLRGRVYQAHGRAVVVTYHPNNLLRTPADKAKAWQDLCLAMDHLASLS